MSNVLALSTALPLSLPQLSSDDMDRQNRIARWRAPLKLPGSEAFSLQRLERPAAQPERPGDRMTLNLTLGAESLTAELPRALVLDLLRSLQSYVCLDPMPPADLAALLLEAALLPLVEVFERGVGQAVCLHGVAEASPHPDPRPVDHASCMRVPFRLRGPGMSQILWVEAPARAIDLLLRNWDAGTRGLDLLPVPLALQAGSTVLPARLIRSLRAGDAVLLQESEFGALHDSQPAVLRLVVADRFVASIGRVQAGWRLETPLGQAWKAGHILSENVTDGLAGVEPVVDLDELPVRLVFEAGRLELALGDVRRLGVGSILEIGTQPGQVRILVNGRRIGDGELISIENRSGVRITALANDAAERDPGGDAGA